MKKRIKAKRPPPQLHRPRVRCQIMVAARQEKQQLKVQGGTYRHSSPLLNMCNQNTITHRSASSPSPQSTPTISYVGYTNERQLPAIMALLDRDLSEPYSIFTYRYFLSGWPELCILVGLNNGSSFPCYSIKLVMDFPVICEC